MLGIIILHFFVKVEHAIKDAQIIFKRCPDFTYFSYSSSENYIKNVECSRNKITYNFKHLLHLRNHAISVHISMVESEVIGAVIFTLKYKRHRFEFPC